MNWDWNRAALGRRQVTPLDRGWQECRITDISRIVNGLPYDSRRFGATGEPLIRIRSLLDPEDSTRYDGPELTKYRVYAGTLLVGMDGDFNIARWARREPGLLNQRVLAVLGEDNLVSWISYALPDALRIINDLTYATTVKHLSSRQVANIRVPLPPPEQFTSTLDYLDRETAEIDALISEQESLSRLLKERRDAELAMTVAGITESTGPDTTTAPWLEGRRTDFEVKNIRRVAAMRTGHTPNRSTPSYWEGEKSIPWFTLADVWQLRAGQKYLGETNESITEVGLANSAADLLPAGTVVLSRTASVGFTGIMPRLMATSQDFWNWVCTDALIPDYLWLQFRAMKPYFDRIKSGSTHKTIYQADAAALQIVIPPLKDQKRIIDTLSAADVQAGALIADSTRAIALAKERRAALITAAVTGQIDVTAKHRPAAEQLEDDIKELS